jgi:hypothetical protein
MSKSRTWLAHSLESLKWFTAARKPIRSKLCKVIRCDDKDDDDYDNNNNNNDNNNKLAVCGPVS